MKRSIIMLLSIVLLIFLLLIIWFNFLVEKEKLSYIVDESYFHDFIIEETGNVIFKCDITVRNNTNEKLLFNMKADMSEDIGLTKEKNAFAFEGSSENYKVFEIAPKSTQTYEVKFKVLHGDKRTKVDRNPPDDVSFIILEKE